MLFKAIIIPPIGEMHKDHNTSRPKEEPLSLLSRYATIIHTTVYARIIVVIPIVI